MMMVGLQLMFGEPNNKMNTHIRQIIQEEIQNVILSDEFIEKLSQRIKFVDGVKQEKLEESLRDVELEMRLE